MALVAFIRGVNVGGHRRFRPSLLAKELRAYDVVNIGAAGTLVVRKPGSRAKFLAALRVWEARIPPQVRGGFARPPAVRRRDRPLRCARSAKIGEGESVRTPGVR